MKPWERAMYVFRWVIMACITGVVVGPIAAVVWHGADWFMSVSVALRWMYLLPVVGALLVGVAVHSFVRRASGEGAPTYIASVNLRGGFVPVKLTALYLLGFVLTVGTGGSGGLVGPMTLIGGGIANSVGRVLGRTVRWPGLSRRDLRQMTVCGAAAGVGAVLGAPVGGGIFAVELLRADAIEYGFLFPAIVASAAGTAVARVCGVEPLGWHGASAAIPAAGLLPAVLIVLAVSISAGFSGMVIVWMYRRATAIRFGLRTWMPPMIGAAVCVACAIAIGEPGLRGTSAPMLRRLFESPAAVGVLACIAVLVGKSLATIGTVGSGGNGGLTMPMLVAGGYLGAVWAGIFGLSGPVAQTAVVGGAAALLSAVLNVPIASAVISIEIFGMNHAIAAALGATIAFAVAKSEVVYSYSETRT